MNCLEFRRRLATDPGSRDPELVAHARGCSECAPALARAARLEQGLHQAVRVPVPENLASRILLRHSFDDRHRARRRRLSLALAASVVVLVAGALAARFGADDVSALETEVLSLMRNATYALEATGPVSADAVAEALRPIGLGMEGSIGNVTFAGRCVVKGTLSGHIVLRGSRAPITVFLIPQTLVARRESIHPGAWNGVVVPHSSGTIAVVAEPGETLDAVAERVGAMVRWSTG